MIYWCTCDLLVCLYQLYSEKGPSLGQMTTVTGACGMSFVESNGNNIPMPRPYIWHNMEVKCILKQLENIKWSSGKHVSSSTNHILPHRPDYKCVSKHDLPTERLGTFLHNDLLQFNLESTVLVLFILKVTKCQDIQPKVIELQKFTQNIISRRDAAKNQKYRDDSCDAWTVWLETSVKNLSRRI